ncbi:MAG: efflux transporter outer membrane subunit [Gammaproteobacteria bacterium]|nr:efflux transporter outer membrane subunit [Gammaproteobacteria bacterium]
MKKNIYLILILTTTVFLSGCTVGPNYHRPTLPVPLSYKEAKNWQVAKPNDAIDRGQWWLVFNSKTLNSLESQLIIGNQTIAVSLAQYQQALFIVQEARAAYFPTLSLNASVIQQVTSSSGSSNSGVNNFSAGNNGSTNVSQLAANASWQADLWGNVRRTVEADVAAAEVSKAQLASARLSAQASLAQYYFELRGVDSDKKLLTQTVCADKKILVLTKNLLHNGVDSMVNVLQARAQLENDQALLINLGVNRGQYEHAIAVLIGKAPSELALPYHPFFGKPPVVPAQLPSQLLERRPDIAAAERNMAEANAQIGVAIAAFFPTLNFSPVAMMQTLQGISSQPLYSWSVGPALAQILFDGGLRGATAAAAKANYRAMVASYRQTVLAAFQNVEDNLVAVRVLKSQALVQDKAAIDANLALDLTVNQFKSGTASYPNVLTAQLNAYAAEKSAVDLTTLRMTSTVGLITALGGGFYK